MNQVLSLIQSERAATDTSSLLYSDHMLSELLHLQEEMIAQLCLERLEAATNAAFLTAMIDQHEATAALLRTHLEERRAATSSPFSNDLTRPPEGSRFLTVTI
jgi:hypothetical protein